MVEPRGSRHLLSRFLANFAAWANFNSCNGCLARLPDNPLNLNWFASFAQLKQSIKRKTPIVKLQDM